jgi:hypothetical protein
MEYEKQYVFTHSKTSQSTLLRTCLRAALACVASCALVFTTPLVEATHRVCAAFILIILTLTIHIYPHTPLIFYYFFL